MGASGRPRIGVVGPVNVDLFIRGDAPRDMEELTRWVGPSAVELVAAGSIGYTVQVLARLGCEVEVCTTVGDDPFGVFLRSALAAAGLGTSHVATAHGDTAIAIYMLLFGDAKRPFTYRLPSFAPWPDPPTLLDGRAPRPDMIVSGGLLHFPEMAGRGLGTLFAEARREGIRTAIDPQFPLVETAPPWLPLCADVLAEADILLCDEGEGRALFGVGDVPATIETAHAAGPAIVAVKRGEAGCIVSDGRRRIEQPAVTIPAQQIREAVGAGDAFDAGFLDALARGMDLAEAARRATATAALSLTGRGGAESVPGPDAVGAMLDVVPPSRTAEASPG